MCAGQNALDMLDVVNLAREESEREIEIGSMCAIEIAACGRKRSRAKYMCA